MKKEPKILLRMREDIARKLGLDIQPISEEEDAALMKIGKENNSFRFSEAVNTINEKSKVGFHYFRLLFNWATANSNYWYCWWWRWWWWWYQWCWGTWPWYAIYGWVWISRGGHGKDDVIEWKGYFHWEQRISIVFVHWAWCPGQSKLDYSQDGSDKYTTYQDWKSTHGGNWVWLAQRYWWWNWRYWSFAQSIVFDEPVWIRIWRIHFKNPIYYYFGLYRCDTYSSDYNIQIRSAAKSDVHDCIVTETGHSRIRGGSNLYLMNCLDAISLNDGRELWQYKKFDGVFYKGAFCWDAAGSDVSDKGKLILWQCHYGANQRYYMFADGKIRVLQDMNQCVTASGDKVVENVVLGSSVSASSTIADTEHTPERISEGKGDSYWASELGAKKAELTVVLKGSQVITSLEINFQYMPADFEVGGLSEGGAWMTFENFIDNDKSSVTINTGVRVVTALRVTMTKPHPVSGMFKGKSVFGIKSMKAQSVFKAIKFQKCDENKESKTNTWLLDDMTFFDISTHLITNSEKAKVYVNLNNLLPVINGVLTIPKYFPKIEALAKEKRTSLEKIELDLKDLTVKLTLYKNFVYTKEVKKNDGPSALGSGVGNPATDCYVIKKVFPKKLSGYFWIQPDCANNPIRVYCDFENGEVPYAYVGSFYDGNSFAITRPEQIQHICAKVGLYALEIKSAEMMKTLMKYFMDLGISLEKDVIPLGYDYTCNKACKGRYHSLNAEISVDVTTAFAAFKDTGNVMNAAFKGSYNAVGMGLNPGTVFYFNLDDFPVRGVMCSTNHEGKSPGYVNVDCFSKASGNPAFNGGDNTVIKVICPPGCTEIKEAEVWGLMSYKDDSSVCRAAIHAGAIKGDDGGKVMVALSPGKSSYDGNQNFGVESKPFNQYWDRSFIVNPFVVRCPIEKFERKKAAASFIEFEEEVDPGNFMEPFFKLDKKNKALNNIKPPPKNRNDIQNEIDSFDQSNAPGGFNFLELLNSTDHSPPKERRNGEDEKFINSIHYHKGSGPKDSRPSFVRPPSYGSTDSKMLGEYRQLSPTSKKQFFTEQDNQEKKDDKKDDKKDGDKKDEKKEDEKEESDNDSSPGSKPKDTMEARKYVSRIYSFQNRDLRKAVKLTKEVSKLVEELNTLMGPIQTSNIAADALNQDQEKLKVVGEATSRVIDKLTVAANSRVKDNERTLRLAKLEVMRLKKYEKYEEKYEFEIDEVYERTDFSKAARKPSNWQVYNKALSGSHTKAIAQTSDIQCSQSEGCVATMIALRYRRFHDAKMTFAFNSRSEGDMGIVFRLKDPFNYYIFEARNNPGFMRVRRVANGQSTIVYSQDGGITQNVWYNVQLVVKKTTFEIRMGEEDQGSGDSLPLVFDTDDQELASGRFGFAISKNSALFIDKFTLEPLECVQSAPGSSALDPNDPNNPKRINFLPPSSNRFYENYFGVFEYRWIVQSPKAFKNGPAIWKFQGDVNERKKAIYQATTFSSPYPDKIGTFTILNYQKTCKDCFVTIDCFAKRDGIIGIAFRYEDFNNYYLFEIGGQTLQFMRLKKVYGGKFTILSKAEGKGYELNSWFRVNMFLANDKIKIYCYDLMKQPDEAFPTVQDEDLKEGTFAFSTFMTEGGFDQFRFFPLGDLEKDSDDSGLPSDIEAELSSRVEVKPLEPRHFNNLNSKKVEWSRCLAMKSPDERIKDCQDTYGLVGKDAVEYCIEHYCKMCCEKQLDWIYKIPRMTCTKECTEGAEPTHNDKEWRMCIDPKSPKRSTYAYCDMNFPDKKEQIFCKLDFCHLCCVQVMSVVKKKMDDEALGNCHTVCTARYTEEKNDILIMPKS